MSDGLSREEIHETIDSYTQELLEAASIREPPIQPLIVARHLGLDLASIRTPGRARRTDESELTEEQKNWLIAQQIGTTQKAEIFRRLDVDPERTRGLSGASLPNLFAEALLIPSRWLRDGGRSCDWDLLALSRRFRTASLERVALRLLDLPDPCIITIIDNEQVHIRKSNACRPERELSEPEQRCQEYVHRYGRPHEVSDLGWRVQGWPDHCADWKREILRSQTEEM